MSASEIDDSDTFVNATSATWSTDMFHFTSNVSSKMGFGIRRFADDPYLTQNILGISPNSTLFSVLKEAGVIASRSWSMYWGYSGAPETQHDGTFVLGGYDSTKVIGKNYTFPLTYDTGCGDGLAVTITDVSITFPNGTDANLFTSASTSLKACIIPDYPVLMTLPYDPLFYNLQLAAGMPSFSQIPETHSFGPNFWGDLFSSEYESVVDVYNHYSNVS